MDKNSNDGTILTEGNCWFSFALYAIYKELVYDPQKEIRLVYDTDYFA